MRDLLRLMCDKWLISHYMEDIVDSGIVHHVVSVVVVVSAYSLPTEHS